MNVEKFIEGGGKRKVWDAQTRTGSRGPPIFVNQPAKPIASHHKQIVRVAYCFTSQPTR
jgi:hypothetical protein